MKNFGFLFTLSKAAIAVCLLVAAEIVFPNIAWAKGMGVGHPHQCPIPEFAEGRDASVQMGLTITTQGAVTDVVVLNSSGYADLDQAAVDCVREWTYNPAREGGNPVAAPWLANVRYGNPPPEPAIFEQLFSDVRACVQTSGILDHWLAGPSAITELQLTSSSPEKTDMHHLRPSGSAALDDKVVECVRASPALAGIAAALGGRPKVLSVNWSIIQQSGR